MNMMCWGRGRRREEGWGETRRRWSQLDTHFCLMAQGAPWNLSHPEAGRSDFCPTKAGVGGYWAKQLRQRVGPMPSMSEATSDSGGNAEHPLSPSHSCLDQGLSRLTPQWPVLGSGHLLPQEAEQLHAPQHSLCPLLESANLAVGGGQLWRGRQRQWLILCHPATHCGPHGAETPRLASVWVHEKEPGTSFCGPVAPPLPGHGVAYGKLAL